LHVELLKEENYLEVFATVSERALLKVRPLVAIAQVLQCYRRVQCGLYKFLKFGLFHLLVFCQHRP
jgi:hypothetical protein